MDSLEYTGPGHFRRIAPGVTGEELLSEEQKRRKLAIRERQAAKSRKAGPLSWSYFGSRNKRRKK